MKYSRVAYPPHAPWDPRLKEPACAGLVPVETLHENPWFRVRNRGGYYTIEHRQSHVIVLPIVNQDSIVMVRAKRPVVGDDPLELPAGQIENGEAPEQGAGRELAEETGIEVGDLTRFVPMPPLAHSPGRTPKLVFVFRIDLDQREYDERKNHDDEVSAVERFNYRDMVRAIGDGSVYVSTPVAVIGRYLMSELLPGLDRSGSGEEL